MKEILLWFFLALAIDGDMIWAKAKYVLNLETLTEPQVVSLDSRLVIARIVAREHLKGGICRKAMGRFPVDPPEDLFSGKYTIGIHPGMLPIGPMARGATMCEASMTNMILSHFWIMLSDPSENAEVIIHEYVHLLQCAIDPPIPDEEVEGQARMAAAEIEAYVISKICMGDPIAATINEYGFAPEGFEKWDN